MNHSAQGMKHSKSLSHLTPIAPAPLLAPRPVQVLPKPVGIAPAMPTSTSTLGAKHMSTTSVSSLDPSKALPCIITSKQWVLPPRPKAGRKPVHPDKKKQTAVPPPPVKRQNSVTSMTNTMNNLNIHKSLSENIAMNRGSSPGSTVSSSANDLKHQLDSATQENQKLKSIISWLKIEIDQLQRSQTPTTGMSPSISHASLNTTSKTMMSSPTLEAQQTAAQIHYQLHGTALASTPQTSSMLTSREVSPSTVDPKDIGMVKPRQKRQYKKKKKPIDDTKMSTSLPTTNFKAEDTPSPIALHRETIQNSDLPTVETIMNDELLKSSTHPSKRCKTLKLERSLSATTDLLSPPSYALNGVDFNDVMPSSHMLSRTTTNTTIDPMEFGWPGKDCGFCSDGGPCLCLEKSSGQEMKRGVKESTILEESLMEEVDVNALFKENDYDEFLML